MESRSVYLGIATRLRGDASGVLTRRYLHSRITEALWFEVTETSSMFTANLSHAVMLASMYGNPEASLDKGNEQIHEMYVKALKTIPYIRVGSSVSGGGADALVEEWRRINAEREAEAAQEQVKEVADA